MSKTLTISYFLAVVAVVSSTAYAHNKVVVIPMAGEDFKAPPFRIVQTRPNAEAGEGRLEFTSDKNPRPKSTWGKVCDDCFEGGNDCHAPMTPKTHSAASAVCKDLGYQTGVALTGDAGGHGALDFSLDEVVCPVGAQSFDECTSAPVNTHNCNVGEEVNVHCLATLPKIVVPRFHVGCFNSGDYEPFKHSKINDSDLTSPAVEPSVTEDVIDMNARVDPGTMLISLVPTDGGTGGYQFTYDCQSFTLTSQTNQPLTVKGTSGLEWVISTTVAESSQGFVTVEDIVFELAP